MNSAYHLIRYLILVFLLNPIIIHAQEGYPDISGTWLSEKGNKSENESTYIIFQDNKNLSGNYSDKQNGKLLLESPIIGFIDKQGNVIFDLYIGKVTATNRLKLSDDGTKLEGTFSTTFGNKGQISLKKIK